MLRPECLTNSNCESGGLTPGRHPYWGNPMPPVHWLFLFWFLQSTVSNSALAKNKNYRSRSMYRVSLEWEPDQPDSISKIRTPNLTPLWLSYSTPLQWKLGEHISQACHVWTNHGWTSWRIPIKESLFYYYAKKLGKILIHLYQCFFSQLQEINTMLVFKVPNKQYLPIYY